MPINKVLQWKIPQITDLCSHSYTQNRQKIEICIVAITSRVMQVCLKCCIHFSISPDAIISYQINQVSVFQVNNWQSSNKCTSFSGLSRKKFRAGECQDWKDLFCDEIICPNSTIVSEGFYRQNTPSRLTIKRLPDKFRETGSVHESIEVAVAGHGQTISQRIKDQLDFMNFIFSVMRKFSPQWLHEQTEYTFWAQVQPH